ncbi:MAG TPA: hypothetical protein VGH38_26605 [Bryobacteraceae bacterium]
MDFSGSLESIAKSLPNLPMEGIESMLVTFDTLVGLSGDSCRPDAARFLREAAALCPDPSSQARLLLAARSVTAGEPCALTPEGLTGAQAARSQTITMEEWQARGGDPPLTEPAVEEPEADDEELYLAEEPPSLPHLRVRHFFPGLVVRVAREFTDANGRLFPVGRVLRVLTCESADDGGITVSLLERSLRLSPEMPGYREIAENAGNQWFQPVPTIGCLEELWQLVDDRLNELDLDDDSPESEFAQDVAVDVATCEEWLFASGEKPAPPACSSAPFAAEVFGRDNEMTAWIALLFAAIAVCKEDS